MRRKKILLVGGTLNQTKIVHAVSRYLSSDHDCYFSSLYYDGLIDWMSQHGLVEAFALGQRLSKRSDDYCRQHILRMDYGGRLHNYDLVVLTSDLMVPKNVRDKPIVLIQEGMTDPEDLRFWLVKYLKLPRWIAGTSTTGLSDAYRYFCVASEGYRNLFIHKGCRPDKVIVTGIPNFDNVQAYCHNDFPYRDYVLVATSNARETYKLDNRARFLGWAQEIAQGRPLIFKLHPAENVERATTEIKAIAPQAMVFAEGNTEHMIANCRVLVTQYSTCVYIGLALGKECYSYFDIRQLQKLAPLQNGGVSGWRIAQVCRQTLGETARVVEHSPYTSAFPAFQKGTDPASPER